MTRRIEYVGSELIFDNGTKIEEKRLIGTTLYVRTNSGIDSVTDLIANLPENAVFLHLNSNTIYIENSLNDFKFQNNLDKVLIVYAKEYNSHDYIKFLVESLIAVFSKRFDVENRVKKSEINNEPTANSEIISQSIPLLIEISGFLDINTGIKESLEVESNGIILKKKRSSKKDTQKNESIEDEKKISQLAKEFSGTTSIDDDSWVTMKKFQIKPTSVKDLTNKFFSTLKKVDLDELFKSEIIDDKLRIEKNAFISDITKAKADSIMHNSGVNLYISAKMDEDTLRNKWNLLQDIFDKQSNFKIND